MVDCARDAAVLLPLRGAMEPGTGACVVPWRLGLALADCARAVPARCLRGCCLLACWEPGRRRTPSAALGARVSTCLGLVGPEEDALGRLGGWTGSRHCAALLGLGCLAASAQPGPLRRAA